MCFDRFIETVSDPFSKQNDDSMRKYKETEINCFTFSSSLKKQEDGKYWTTTIFRHARGSPSVTKRGSALQKKVIFSYKAHVDSKMSRSAWIDLFPNRKIDTKL